MNVEEARKLTKIGKKNQKHKIEGVIFIIYKDILNRIKQAANRGNNIIAIDFSLYPIIDTDGVKTICDRLKEDGFSVYSNYENKSKELPKMFIDWGKE